MGGKGKRRHQNASNQSSGKRQKQSGGRSKEDGGEGTTIVLPRNKKTPMSTSSNYPIPGLMNLGNTCFFNSVMQNLAQTHYLMQRLQAVLSQEQTKIVLPSPRESLPPLQVSVDSKPGKFAQDFHAFLVEMRTKAKLPLNPRIVFSHVCKNAPRFSSYQQQDSQELLRYLLDALRNEEVYRIKRGILEFYNVKGRATEKKPITEQEKKAIKAYGIQATLAPTFVEDVFGGKLVSTVTCQECETRYDIQEDFLDLSLPVPVDTTKTGFSSRSSFKNKRNKATCHSSEDAEGDDELEGMSDSRGKSKEEPRLSKPQQKQKRKEERKRSKAKRYSLDQFHKQTNLGEELKKISPECKSSFEFLPINGSASQTAFENQDSCLADDEITFHSTQQDSDSSALFMQSLDAKEDVPPPTESSEDNQLQVQNFTAEEDDSPNTQSWNNDKEAAVKTITDQVESMTLDGIHQQNLSESVVVMFESQAASKGTGSVIEKSEGIDNDTKQENHTTGDTEPSGSVVDEQGKWEVGSPTADDGEWVPKFGPRGSEVSVTDVTASLQNIETKDDQAVPSQTLAPVQEIKCNEENSASVNVSEPKKTNGACSKPEPISAGDKSAENSTTHWRPPKSEASKFSLESCLQQFTSPEWLTGTDKFCCESCTKRQQQSQSQNEKSRQQSSELVQSQVTQCDGENDLEGRDGQPDKGTNSIDADLGARDGKTDQDHLSALIEIEEGLPVERSVSSTSSSISAEENTKEDEDTEMLESTKESDDMYEDRSSTGSDRGEAVFCDAIKQMLIDKPPAVLCLHLKRFIQQGRNFKNMRKNSCHIAFPFLLDIAPYSTHSCKEFFSITGELLYSLYGVVVHGGGMHGGHYTAFVRVRNELQLKDLLSEKNAQSDLSSSLAVDPPIKAMSNNEQPKRDGLPEATSPPSGISDEKSSESVRLVHTDNDGTLPNDALGLADPKVPRSSSPIITGNSQEPQRTTNVDLPSNDNRCFDVSSLGGQWYHISDGHVKKSSESDVLKSEAYLLFYERLPHSDVVK